MADSHALPDPDLLLEHAEFLKAIARGLLRDEHEAEDIAQDTVLAAIEKAPGPGSLRGWLAAVTRNLARTRLTSRSRRRDRERRGARPEDSEPSVEEAL